MATAAKKAMWKVDRTGGLSFSDKHGLGQLTLLNGYTDNELAEDMKRGLVGQTLSVAQIKEWVMVEIDRKGTELREIGALPLLPH